MTQRERSPKDGFDIPSSHEVIYQDEDIVATWDTCTLTGVPDDMLPEDEDDLAREKAFGVYFWHYENGEDYDAEIDGPPLRWDADENDEIVLLPSDDPADPYAVLDVLSPINEPQRMETPAALAQLLARRFKKNLVTRRKIHPPPKLLSPDQIMSFLIQEQEQAGRSTFEAVAVVNKQSSGYLIDWQEVEKRMLAGSRTGVAAQSPSLSSGSEGDDSFPGSVSAPPDSPGRLAASLRPRKLPCPQLTSAWKTVGFTSIALFALMGLFPVFLVGAGITFFWGIAAAVRGRPLAGIIVALSGPAILLFVAALAGALWGGVLR
jgi:hypothetical protein